MYLKLKILREQERLISDPADVGNGYAGSFPIVQPVGEEVSVQITETLVECYDFVKNIILYLFGFGDMDETEEVSKSFQSPPLVLLMECLVGQLSIYLQLPPSCFYSLQNIFMLSYKTYVSTVRNEGQGPHFGGSFRNQKLILSTLYSLFPSPSFIFLLGLIFPSHLRLLENSIYSLRFLVITGCLRFITAAYFDPTNIFPVMFTLMKKSLVLGTSCADTVMLMEDKESINPLHRETVHYENKVGPLSLSRTYIQSLVPLIISLVFIALLYSFKLRRLEPSKSLLWRWKPGVSDLRVLECSRDSFLELLTADSNVYENRLEYSSCVLFGFDRNGYDLNHMFCFCMEHFL
jgi:hypothetical protein